jgi:hypothetical protein
MRHTLANAIVHGNERTLGFKGTLHRPPQKLRVLKERANKLSRQVRQSFEMFFRNQQAMAGKQRTMVEKGHGDFILKHY